MNKKAVKNYFSVQETADLLHISRQAVLKKINSHQLKAERVGRNFIVQSEEVKDFLAIELTEKVKRQIEDGVAEVIKQYGEVLKKLGRE